MAWKAVSRSTIQHHVLWYNGSGPPPISTPVTIVASLPDLLTEVSKLAPEISEDRARLVCDCRGITPQADALIRELLKKLREVPDATEMKVLLFGSTDQTPADSAHTHVSTDADVLDRFVNFRGLLVGQKSTENALSMSKRRVQPLASPKQALIPAPAVDPPPLPTAPPDTTPPPMPPRSPRETISAVVQTPPINTLALSGGAGRFTGFASSTAAAPKLAPSTRSTSYTQITKPKLKFTGGVEATTFDAAGLKEYLRGLRSTSETAPLFLQDLSQANFFFEELGHSPPLEETHFLASISELWPHHAILDAFKGNRSLKTLHFSGQLAPSRQITAMGFDAMLGQEVATMGPANLRLFLVRLPVLTTRSKVLTTLRLVGHKNCGNMLHQLLRTALESSVSLTKLSLSASDLPSPKHSPLKKLATYSIFKALTRRSCLVTDLDLSDCGLLSEELEMSLQLLSKNVSLTTLDLSGNGILNIGAVTQLFRSHPSLMNLNYMQGNTGVAGKRSEVPIMRTRGDLASNIPSLMLVWCSGPGSTGGVNIDSAVPRLARSSSSKMPRSTLTGSSTIVSENGDEELVSVGNMTASYTPETSNSNASDVVFMASPAAVDFWLKTSTGTSFGNITSLAICNCSLVQLPAALTEMARLTVLDASCNSLEDVAVLQNTPHLLKLFLHHNSLTKLPPPLQRLRTLDMSNNYARTFALTPGMFPLLRRVSLRENPLAQMSGIDFAPDLRRLDIEWCRMEYLPLEMRRSAVLNQLRILGNPIAAVLPDTTDPRPLVAHLDVVEREAQAFPVVKVLLLGDEGVGKTSVAKGLAHVAKRTTGTTESDSAMQITECTFESDKFRVPPRLSLWDFGVRGNDALSLTTSFFITERTLYLIVFNMTNWSEAQLEFWLSSIAARVVSTQKAPIFLIGTHSDQCSSSAIDSVRERLSTQLLPSYPGIVGFAAVSSGGKHMKGYAELVPRLLDTLKTKRLVGFTVPPSWLQVILALRLPLVLKTLRVHASMDYCSWSTFQLLAERVGVTEGFEQLISFLTERGFVAHMGRDERNPLRDWVFMNPAWLLTATRKLFTGNLNFVRKGRLMPNDVAQLWGQLPESGSSLLLKLLQYFEIIYYVSEDDAHSRYYLVPHLLETDAPDCSILWPPFDEKQQQFQRSFSLATLPVGLMSRILIRMISSTKVRLAWQNGMILQYADQFAYIVLLPSQRVLRVTVRRPRAISGAVPLLNTIVEVVDALCTKWFSVKLVKSVSCAHCLSVAQSANHPHEFKLNDLELEVARGATNARCPLKNADVEIRGMLPSFVASVTKLRLVPSELKLGKELGKGAYGSVCEGTWREEAVAVKQMHVTAEEIASVMQELLIMSSLVHPNILAVRGFVVEPNMCIVMDLAQYGDLHTYLRLPDCPLPDPVRLRVALDIASAMSYVHSLTPPLIHRDLKSPNVLLISLDPFSSVVAKLSDFGLSCRVIIDSHRESARNRAVGNPRWLAPEVTRGEPYSLASDVYSYGLLMWELYSTDIELEEGVQSGIRPTVPATAPADYVELMKQCWSADVSARPTFTHVTRQLRIVTQRIGGGQPVAAAEALPVREERLRTTTFSFLPPSGSMPVPASASSSAVIESHLSRQLHLDRRPQCLLFVESSSTVWVGCREGHLLVLNAENGNLIAQAKAHVSDITALLAVANGLVVSASVDGMLKFWRADMQTKREVVPASNPWLRSSVPDLTQSDDPSLRAPAAISSGTVRARDERASSSVSAASNPHLSATHLKNGIRVPERDGKLSMRVTSLFNKSWKHRHAVLSPKHPGIMHLLEDGKSLHDINLSRATLDVEPAGEPDDAFVITVEGLEKEKPRTYLLLAASSQEKAAWVNAIRLTIELFKSDPLIELAKQVEMGVPVTCLELLGDLLVAGSGDGRVRTFNVNTLRSQQTIIVNDAHRPIACLLTHGNAIWLGVHQSIAKLQRGDDNVLVPAPILEGHQSSVTCLEVVEEVLWSGSADGELRRWDLNSGVCLSASASGMPRLFTILRAGSRVWCGGMSSEIFIYSSEDGKRIDTAAMHKEAIIALNLVWANTVWSASWDKSICIWS